MQKSIHQFCFKTRYYSSVRITDACHCLQNWIAEEVTSGRISISRSEPQVTCREEEYSIQSQVQSFESSLVKVKFSIKGYSPFKGEALCTSYDKGDPGINQEFIITVEEELKPESIHNLSIALDQFFTL